MQAGIIHCVLVMYTLSGNLCINLAQLALIDLGTVLFYCCTADPN